LGREGPDSPFYIPVRIEGKINEYRASLWLGDINCVVITVKARDMTYRVKYKDNSSQRVDANNPSLM